MRSLALTALWMALAVASWVEAAGNRLAGSVSAKPAYRNYDRRRFPRECPLCGGPMRPDRRHGDRLAWFFCVRCERSRIGVPTHKLNGRSS